MIDKLVADSQYYPDWAYIENCIKRIQMRCHPVISTRIGAYHSIRVEWQSKRKFSSALIQSNHIYWNYPKLTECEKIYYFDKNCSFTFSLEELEWNIPAAEEYLSVWTSRDINFLVQSSLEPDLTVSFTGLVAAESFSSSIIQWPLSEQSWNHLKLWRQICEERESWAD